MAISPQAQKRIDFFLESGMRKVFAEPAVFAATVAEERAKQEKRQRIEMFDFAKERCNLDEYIADDGTQIFVMEPKSGTKSDLVIVYYHGGGFLFDVGIGHVTYCLTLMDALECTVVLPVVPLVPTADCDRIIASSVASYRSVLDRYPHRRIVFAGESAGGSLCLAVSMSCPANNLPQPRLIVTCSPFIDFTGTVEESLGYPTQNDPLIEWYGSRELAKLYSGSHDPHAFPPDPFFGPKENLAPLLIFASTNEVLCAGAREFCRMVEEAGGQVDYQPSDGLWHAFLLDSKSGIPEVDEAFEYATKAIKAC